MIDGTVLKALVKMEYTIDGEVFKPEKDTLYELVAFEAIGIFGEPWDWGQETAPL